MFLVARKNLFSERIRLAISVGGVAVSVFLIGILLSLYRGWDEKVGEYVVVGLSVAGLTIYTATVEKSREYGILKAEGSTNRFLYRVVIEQSLVTKAPSASCWGSA